MISYKDSSKVTLIRLILLLTNPYLIDLTILIFFQIDAIL